MIRTSSSYIANAAGAAHHDRRRLATAAVAVVIRWANYDPLTATYHTQIIEQGGIWRIEARPSKNGVWVQVRSIPLTRSCRFQCGEQRFLFVV
jgi:hypothetical protein